ncbi:MAG: hypothetical protein R3B72_40740 [Polyangiaceae bacterium]
MGFFSNLKNAITGGAADVQVQCPNVQRGMPAVVQIWATAKGAGNVNGVYLLVRAVERCEVKDTDWEGGQSHTETIRGHRVSWEQRIPVAGGFQMQPGQQMQWQAQIQIPQNIGPSLQGHMISHTWEIQAGLDMTGNDPDSGWVAIQVF